MARPLPIVEIFYDGAWHDVRQDVYSGESIKIARGRRDWSRHADPAEATIPFKQFESAYATAAGGGPLRGRYAPRNPLSDLFGKIGRNTPVRVRLGASAARLYLPGDPLNNAVARTPDVANLRLTGDQRIEMLVRPRTWRPGNIGMALSRRWLVSGDNRAWAWYIRPDGTLRFRSTSDGTAGTDVIRTSSIAIPDTDPERWLAVWIDVNNGAGGNTVGFETSLDGTTWAALGTNQINAGVTSVAAAQAPLDVGRVIWSDSGIIVSSFDGDIGAFRYRSGILSTSTLVSSADFRTLEPGDTTLTDPQAHVWTISAPAYITDRAVRFAGEAAAWPQTWDVSGKVRSSPATIAGVLRRAQKVTTPLRSSLRRDLSTKANVVAYWPMEEAAGAARFASALPGDTSTLTPTDPDEVKFAASDAFVASDPLPTLSNSDIIGTVPKYPANIEQRIVFLALVPEAGIATDRHLARFTTSGSMMRWELIYDSGGGGILRGYDRDGTLIFDHGPTGSALNGTLHMHSLLLEQNGANVDYQWARFPVGSDVAFVMDSGSVAGTFGRFTAVQLGTSVGLDATAMGHVAILNGDVHNIWDTASNSLRAWAGEAGHDRLMRLGADEGFPVRLTGTITEAIPAMGPQRSKTVVELMREVPATDLGMFTDANDLAGALAYRPASSLNRAPVLEIPYNLIGEPFQPNDDDQATVNRVTVKNVNGIELTVEDNTSSMSIQPPPAGVGLYDQSADINADTAAGASGNAWQRLALGTIDASRWPSVPLCLDNPDVAPFAEAILAVELGDIISVTGLPEGIPPGPVDLIVDAIEDDITRALHWVTFTVAPADVWAAAGTWADPTGAPEGVARWESLATFRNNTTSSTQTNLIMTITDGRFWTTTAADFPFDIMFGGERMTVTAIAAPSGSTQTFTVTRGVNGIVKSHPTGTVVRLAEPTVWAL